jgi:hypothetical protein
MESILVKMDKKALIQLQEEIGKLIVEKEKEEALNKSGWVNDDIRVDVRQLSLLEDAYEINFVKWFAKVKLNANSIPKYIHKVTHDDSEDIDYYAFSDEKNSLNIPTGITMGVMIHKDSLKYLLEEYKEWGWNQ